MKLRNLTSALTLDGDRLDSSGYVSGGYKEVGKSLIAVARSLKACGQKRLEAEKRLASIGQESVEFDKRVTCLRNEILQVDHEHKIISASSSNIIMKLKKLQDEHRNVLALISLETSILENAKAEHRKAECKVRTFASEAGSQKLKNSDYDLEKAGQELQKAKREVSTVIQRCEELESLKRSIELELSENLYRQRDDIRLSARTISESSNAENTLSKRRECTSISGGIISNENSLKSISRELEDSNKLLSQKITEIEDNKQEYQNVKKELDKMRFAMEKCMLKRSNIQRVKQEVTTRIRSLGILPSESFEKYQNKPEPELVEMLHKVNSDLKKHAYANKNAFEQFHAFTRQFEQLSERKNELDTSAAAIRNLVSNLDNRKGEAISKSLAQVCKCFSEVWQKLVPTGKGKLIPLRRIGAVSESQDFDEETSLGSSILSQSQARSDSPASITAKSTLKNGKKSGTIPDIDMYTGVSIKVSFNSSDSEGLRLQQLSGGQKSLVALALIFAIQRCDPAPFYLFDEIDAALDSSYRVSIANIIRELSRTAQFITTTFHRELLDGADKYYGISFSDKVSDIKAISCEEATSFVEDAGK